MEQSILTPSEMLPSREVTSTFMATSEISQVSEVNSSIEDDQFVDQQRASSLLAGFSKLYINKEFVDITICVDKQEFSCHKNVLAVSCPYFMAMFSNNMAESHQEKVTLKDIDSQTMSLVLDYIYTGQVLLTEETVQNLLSASNLFQLISLRNGCADFMMNHVTVSNCVGVFFFAKAHECEILATKAKEIINSRFPTICEQQEFLSLPADKLVEIISDDDMTVTSEETVYEASLAWLQHDKENRIQHLEFVMRFVRFAIINSYYFCDKIDTNLTLQSNPDLRKTLDLIRYYHILKNRHQEMDLNLMPRRGMVYMRGVMIIANPYTEDTLKKYNSMELLLPKKGEVINICKLPQSLFTPGCAITGDNQIYLAGGATRKINYRGSITADGMSNNLYVFDPIHRTWQPKAKMHMSRSEFCLTIVDGYMFAVGGHDGSEILTSVERYCPHTDCWMLVNPLPQPLRFMTALSFCGKLYVFGGENPTQISQNAYRYDPANDTWTELPPMNTPRVLAGSVVYKENIYVIGGNSKISDKWTKEYLPEHCVSSVEIFDPVAESWSAGPELPNPLCGTGVVKYGNTILVVGGEDDKSWMAGLCWLHKDKDKMTWIEGYELPTVMSTFGCVVANIPHEVLDQQ